jgi:hypothetical protein
MISWVRSTYFLSIYSVDLGLDGKMEEWRSQNTLAWQFLIGYHLCPRTKIGIRKEGDHQYISIG